VIPWKLVNSLLTNFIVAFAAEWVDAPVSKTGEGKPHAGSIPALGKQYRVRGIFFFSAKIFDCPGGTVDSAAPS
jgi:hypothetical protein